MERHQPADLAPHFEVCLPAAPGAHLVYWQSVHPSSKAWECPRCSLMAWTTDAAPRCRRCGFWETAS
jgi:hypothetical protein